MVKDEGPSVISWGCNSSGLGCWICIEKLGARSCGFQFEVLRLFGLRVSG